MQNAHRLKTVSSLALLLLLGACASMPTGPSTMALPGSNKSFDQFQADDASCRQFALNQIGGKTPNEVANDNGVKSAAIGTVLGAAVGGLIGGNQGAAVGAGSGLLLGALSGTDSADRSGYSSQRQYDNAYNLCMYDKGERVPVSGRMAAQRRAAPPAPPPPPPGFQPAGTPPDIQPLYVYPKNGQSDERTETDRRECEHWARRQMPQDHYSEHDLQRAEGACLEARGYSVR
jgi:outer membrane lipoprotein SlyB